jgi:hypothetical protein
LETGGIQQANNTPFSKASQGKFVFASFSGQVMDFHLEWSLFVKIPKKTFRKEPVCKIMGGRGDRFAPPGERDGPGKTIGNDTTITVF